MAFTAPVQPTAIEGLQNDSAGGAQQVPNVAILAGRQLCFAGQTGNTSGASAANQAIGTFGIPAGTPSGGAIAVPNTLIGTGSLVFLQPTGNGGTITGVAVTALVAGTGFTATVYGSGPTTSAVDVWYWVAN